MIKNEEKEKKIEEENGFRRAKKNIRIVSFDI